MRRTISKLLWRYAQQVHPTNPRPIYQRMKVEWRHRHDPKPNTVVMFRALKKRQRIAQRNARRAYQKENA